MHVLVVDDDPLLRRLLAAMLEDGGHTSCWAASGTGALALMRSEKPAAVVLDINLGHGQMTGWDVLREKMLDQTIRGIPVIVISGMAIDDVREGGQRIDDALAGAVLILGKPVSRDQMLGALEHLDAAVSDTDPPKEPA